MNNCLSTVDNSIHDLFLVELHSRISFLPIKSTSGRDCISIDMRCCSEAFALGTSEFLERNSEIFNLLVTGEEYYLELLDFSKFTNVRKIQHGDRSDS